MSSTNASPVDTEPVAVFIGALTVAINAGMVAATALDWIDLTAEQTTTVLAAITAGLGLVGILLRAHVWSPASVEALADAGHEDGDVG